jgi:hypothetical protein
MIQCRYREGIITNTKQGRYGRTSTAVEIYGPLYQLYRHVLVPELISTWLQFKTVCVTLSFRDLCLSCTSVYGDILTFP